jgi:2-polyprenyl-3-methyl-5-hydroxy-6-metoxy-1,4-benzoquinol methylase
LSKFNAFEKLKLMEKTAYKCPLCLNENKPNFMGYRLNKAQGIFPGRDYSDSQKVVCCKCCKLIYNHPQVFPQSDIFNEDDSLLDVTQLSAEEIKATETYTDILNFLKKDAGLLPAAKVLDIGSGIGRVAYVLEQAGYDVQAIEPKKELYEFSIQNNFIAKENISNKTFDDVEFEKESFDFIFLEPLNHFTEPHLAIQKALNWLKPGGYLQLETVNSRWFYKRALHFFYKITFTKIVPYTSPLRKPFHVCEYSAKTFKVYCELNNLKLINLNSHPCNTYIKIKWADRWMQYLMRRFHSGAEMSVIIQKVI